MRARLGTWVLLSLAACGIPSSERDTVPAGRLNQWVTFVQEPWTSAMPLVLALNVPDTPAGRELRGALKDATRGFVQDLVEGRGAVNVTALVVAFDGSDTWSRGSADTPDLVWHENVASSEQGELFRSAVERAIDRAPTVAATSGFLDALLERTARLHEAGSPRVVLATTTDDSAAEGAGYHSSREWTVVLPQGPSNRCAVAPRVAPRLAAWVERQGIDTNILASCEDLRLAPAWADGWWRVCRSAADTPPARCAVRVLIPEGSRCEPERGWRPSATGITGTDGAGLAACDVDALELAEGACDEAAPAAETTPGWCLPEVTERCRRPGPTVVGRARKPGVLYELTCDTPPR
ncbi:MAG: hypothetical protein IPG50_18720 [Myxococcales bacterium]|nr:hypothetical protein [Myxococcales bacterium]